MRHTYRYSGKEAGCLEGGRDATSDEAIVAADLKGQGGG